VKPAFTPAALECFRAHVARHLGLCFVDDRVDFLAEVLERRLAATRLCAAAYLDGISSAPEELRELARELTIGETFFFRHVEQYRALRDLVLPSRLAAGSMPLRLLSAGCASGEEAYSLAIMLREYGLAPAQFSIRAVDVNTPKFSNEKLPGSILNLIGTVACALAPPSDRLQADDTTGRETG